MAGNPELTIWLYPTAGEAFAVTTTDFNSADAALRALENAFAAGSPLRLHQHRDNESATTLVINPANMVAASVRSTSSAAEPGQYL